MLVFTGMLHTHLIDAPLRTFVIPVQNITKMAWQNVEKFIFQQKCFKILKTSYFRECKIIFNPF